MAQGLDRQITVTFNVTTRNEFGEPVTDSTSRNVWASRRDKSLGDIGTEGGSQDVGRRDWRVRWTAELAGIQLLGSSVADDGITWALQGIIELTGRNFADRRRWLLLQGEYSS